MGKLRARTDAELAARKQEIMDAAVDELMNRDYETITLATITEKTSITRTSIYTYYEKKEAVYVDLLILEYQKFGEELRAAFSESMTREAFCRTMTRLLWSHPVLLKLLSLQLSVWDHRYDDDLVKHFVQETAPYMKALDGILAIQFPNAEKSALNMFKIQFSVYCNSLYGIENLPHSQMDAMTEHGFYETIPSGEQICYEGLMLLSAGVAER